METVRKVDLDTAISAVLTPWRKPRAMHDPGTILLDVALAVALGGDCLADVGMLRAEPSIFRPVASDPTVSRLIDILAGISVGTAHAYVHSVVAPLAGRAPGLTVALRSANARYVLLDGTLPEYDRVGDSRANYSGKHRRHGVNLQVITAPDGTLVWISPALAGRVHDLTAARRHQIIATCIRLGIPILADKAYQGAGAQTAVPARRRPGRDLSIKQKSVNRAHSRLRWPVERPIARLKTWRVLRKAHISPNNSRQSPEPSTLWRLAAENAHWREVAAGGVTEVDDPAGERREVSVDHLHIPKVLPQGVRDDHTSVAPTGCAGAAYDARGDVGERSVGLLVVNHVVDKFRQEPVDVQVKCGGGAEGADVTHPSQTLIAKTTSNHVIPCPHMYERPLATVKRLFARYVERLNNGNGTRTPTGCTRILTSVRE